ncbi:CD1871A family CXXC motif-containing protein [Lachnoclostridium phytofermentans]
MIIKMNIRFTRYSILFLAISLLVIGTLNWEYEAVFNKAINICLECIGIG